MKALRFHQFGGPEVLQFDEDVPMPKPKPGQVLVKVAGAGINPVDWKVREGHAQTWFPVDLPAIICWDFSGTVAELGEGVTDFSVGDEVFGTSRAGTCSEYCVADAASIARAPAFMDLADAAAIPIAGMTAYQALFTVGNLQPGQRVLIHAAAGGVGSFAVQLAKWKGAHVIATSSARHHHLLEQFEVDEIVDYQKVPFETVVKDVDLAVETVGGEEQMLRTLSTVKPGGLLVSVTSAEPTEAAIAQGKRAEYLFMQDKRADLERLAALIQDLKVRPILSTVAKYHEAIEALNESQSGRAQGKLVIRVS